MGAAATDCACAEMGRLRRISDKCIVASDFPFRSERPVAPRKLGGSSGRRTRAQGFLGHVVMELPRLYLEGTLKSALFAVTTQCYFRLRIQLRAARRGRLLVPTALCGARGACWEL